MDRPHVPTHASSPLVELLRREFGTYGNPGQVVQVIGGSTRSQNVLDGNRVNAGAGPLHTGIAAFDQVLGPHHFPDAGTEFHAVFAGMIETREEIPVQASRSGLALSIQFVFN